MKAGLLRICPGRMAIRKREHVVTGLRIALFDGRVNSDVFYAWLIQELLPRIPAGAVIVMDNVSFHKRHDMLEAISANQCKVEFLPPYSPDLNPIEPNGLKPKPSEGDTGVVLMNSFPDIHNMSFYNDLAISSKKR